MELKRLKEIERRVSETGFSLQGETDTHVLSASVRVAFFDLGFSFKSYLTVFIRRLMACSKTCESL